MTFFSLIQTQPLVLHKKGCLNFEPIKVSKKDWMNISRVFSKNILILESFIQVHLQAL